MSLGQELEKKTIEMDSTSHILAVPLPLQGHMNPMMQLCKRLSSNGVRVTVITTLSISQKHAFGCDFINIDTVPDSTLAPDEHLDYFANFFHSLQDAISSGLPDIIHRHRSSVGLGLKAVIYDSLLPWMLDLDHEHELKGAVLFTQSCTVCSVYHHLHKGSFEPPDEDDDSFEVSLPGMPVMTGKDLPSYICDTSSYPSVLKLLTDQFSTSESADWRLFNTFDKLEHEVLKWMENQHPILSIGPTVPSKYLDNRIPENRDYGLSLFKPDAFSCMKWLDTKEDRSVIYVSFGSIINLGEKQMDELARGLIDSKCNFLWVVRDPNESGIPLYVTTYEKGLVVNWCPQLEVLSHRAVGCFITHCGWNSTLEAMISGVPMVGIPQRGDQPTNAKLIADVWEIGVRAKIDIENGTVTREEIARLVKYVMNGEKGEDIRAKASKLKDLAIQSVSEGGSSDQNIMIFVSQLLSP